MTTLSVAFLFLVLVWVIAVVVGLQFRSGRNRAWASIYRNPLLPRAFRLLPLVAPEIGALALPALILSAPVLLDLDLD